MSASQKIAITGGTGFIGGALARAPHARGDEVKILTRGTLERARAGVAGELESLGATLISGDLDDPSALATLSAETEVMIHCAAFMGKRDPDLSERVNVQGTQNLLDACHQAGVRRFIYVSSISVYRGTTTPSRRFDESIEPYLHPKLNHYSRTKLLGEHLVRASCADRPLEFTIIRPTNVYGPGCRPWGSSVEQLTSRYHICFGRITFNFIHIDDLVRGMIAAAEHEGAANEAFNLGAEPVELWAFHRYIARKIGVWTLRTPQPIDALIRHIVDGVAKLRGEVRSTGYTQLFLYPHDKAAEVYGYQPQHLIYEARPKAPPEAP